MAKKELNELKKQANNGDARAQYNLGIMYKKGQGVEKDYKEAVKWFELAADQGYVEVYIGEAITKII